MSAFADGVPELERPDLWLHVTIDHVCFNGGSWLDGAVSAHLPQGEPEPRRFHLPAEHEAWRARNTSRIRRAERRVGRRVADRLVALFERGELLTAASPSALPR